MRGSRKRWLGIIVLALVAAFAIAACGGDDSTTAEPAPAAPADPEPAPADPEPAPADPEPAPADPEPAPDPEPPAEPEGCQVEGIDDDTIDVFAAADTPSAVIGENISPASHGRMSTLWIDEINAAGGILGCEVTFRVDDDTFDIETCVRLYRDAVASGEFDFFIGPTNSGCMASLPPLTDAAGKWIFTGIAADHQPFFDPLFPDLNNKYVAHPSVSTLLEGRANAVRMKEQGCVRAATIVPNYAYGQDVAKGFTGYFPQIVDGGEIVAEQFPEFDEDQFTPFFNAILAENPDCIMSAFFGAGIAPFMVQWNATGEAENTTVIGGLGSLDTFAAIQASDQVPANFYGYSRGWPTLLVNNPVAAEWIPKWEARFGDEHPIPDQFTFQLLSTWQMAKALIDQTGTIDPDAWKALIETGAFGFDGPYNPGLTYVNPINHMAQTCVDTGALVTDTSVPPFNVTYDPATFLQGCMKDLLPREEALSLTTNPDVTEEAIDTYYELEASG